ncbi:MAG: redoxin domain-containing protein [Planctomycetes bacterium]|nr:redoxin domain-containing protein [Planctomycetota bacterium]MCB9910915.1 redoxin domain-containing protein [Planctomycetota bacterium]MCB9912126.1 redoxin domain-containing protein [Planctomycetota bacterium]HPF13956.1 redoxin domain-containing protein [Planctomycetota bacterium]HRV81153.1 redoxin domain-containing protein [Planctomycetota bacterium]
MFTTLLFTSLMGFAPAPPLASQEPKPVEKPVEKPVAQSTAYADAVAAFETAVAEWQLAIRESKDAAKRRELRRNHPALAFQPRFEALVAEGEGRGLLWLVANQRYLGVPKEKREERALDMYTRLLKDFGNQDWYLSAMQTVATDKELVPMQRINMLKRVMAQVEAPEIQRVAAKFYTGQLLLEESDDASKDMGRQMLKEIVKDHPKTEFAVRARPIVEKVDVSVGAMAPDFLGKSVDGETIRLSDYRGKVVLIDFFGFW